MSTASVGRDGQYRMTIDERYQKLSGVRKEAKIFAVAGGLYGFAKLGLTSLPTLLYQEEVDLVYTAGIAAIVLTFVLYSLASGGGKPHKELTPLLYVYAVAAAAIGSKALLDAWNNPFARSIFKLPAPQNVSPYDQAVAKLLVQQLSINPASAITDVDVLNLVLNGGGALFLLSSAAATFKYLQLKRQPAKAKVEKKTT